MSTAAGRFAPGRSPSPLARSAVTALVPALAVTLSLAGGACSGSADEPVLIPDFRARSPVLACIPVPELTAEALVVDDLLATSGGDVLILSGRSRRILLLDPSGGIVRRISLEEEGPSGVGTPISADLADDSTLLVADMGRMVVKRLDLSGGDLGTVRTPFPPTRVRTAGGRSWVVPGVLGGYPDRLLFRLDGESLVPENLPPRTFRGMTHGGFANRLGAVARPQGGLLLMHGFYIPEAYLLRGRSLTRHPVPVPDALAPLFRDLRPVEREEDLPYLPVVGLSPFVDRVTRDVLYLTRSGARLDAETWEKALIRVDSAFRYVSSGRLPVDALMAAPLEGGQVLLVSNDGEWSRCRAP